MFTFPFQDMLDDFESNGMTSYSPVSSRYGSPVSVSSNLSEFSPGTMFPATRIAFFFVGEKIRYQMTLKAQECLVIHRSVFFCYSENDSHSYHQVLGREVLTKTTIETSTKTTTRVRRRLIEVEVAGFVPKRKQHLERQDHYGDSFGRRRSS